MQYHVGNLIRIIYDLQLSLRYTDVRNKVWAVTCDKNWIGIPKDVLFQYVNVPP